MRRADDSRCEANGNRGTLGIAMVYIKQAKFGTIFCAQLAGR
jgi:hypothetical protein